MVLSVLEATEHINHAIGGPLVGISNQRVLDEAGIKLYRQVDWNFLKRPSALLDFTNGQKYIDSTGGMPEDFGHIGRITYTSGTTSKVEPTTLSVILRMRQVSLPTGGLITFVAPDWAMSATTGAVTPRLEIYPTPALTQVGALTMFYHAGWQRLVDVGTNTPNDYVRGIPLWLEDIYLQFVRAVAWGYQAEGMQQRLAEIIAGPDFASAVRYDSSINWEHGAMTGGMLATADRDAEGGIWYLRTAALPPAAG